MKLLFTAAQYEPLRDMPEIRNTDIEIVATPFLTDEEFREFFTLLTTKTIHNPEQVLRLIKKEVISIAPSLSTSEPQATPAETSPPEILSAYEEAEPQQANNFNSLFDVNYMLPYGSPAFYHAPAVHQPMAQGPLPVTIEMDFPFLTDDFTLFPSTEPTPQRTESLLLKSTKINLKHILVMLTMIKDILSEWDENVERLPQFLEIIDNNYLNILPNSFVTAWQKTRYQNKKPFEIVQHLCVLMSHLLASHETYNDKEQTQIKSLTDGLTLINNIASPKAEYRPSKKAIKEFANQFGRWALEKIIHSPYLPTHGMSLFSHPKSKLQLARAKTIICLVKILRTVFNIPYDSKINEKRTAPAEVPAAVESISKRTRLLQEESDPNEGSVLNSLPRPN